MINIIENPKYKKLLNIFYFICIVFILGIGIFYRAKIYLLKAPFWLDELMLAQPFIDRDIFGLFLPLDANQKAPPLFLVLTYFMIKLFGFNELSFRLLPFISSIFSLIAFYFLLKNFILNKFSIILGLYLFAISKQMIYFSAEFKPYSIDVLICILLLLSFKYIKLKQLSYINAIFYTILSVIMIFLSFPAGLIIFSIILAKFIEEKKLSYNILFIIIGIIYSYIYLFLCDLKVYHYMVVFWFNEFSLLSSLIDGLSYLMNCYTILFKWLFPVIVLVGFYQLYKDKNNYFYLFLFLFIIPIFASIFHIYAFSKRLILFLFPILILMILKLFESNPIENKYLKIVTKISLSFIIISLVIKIPLFSLSENTLIEQAEDFPRSLEQRLCIKNTSLYILDNFKKGDKILASDEFIYFIKFYNRVNAKNNNISFNKYKMSTIEEYLLKKEKGMKTCKDFIEKNKNKPNTKLWIFGRDLDSYYGTPNYKYIKEILNSNDLKYDYKLKEDIYLFEI